MSSLEVLDHLMSRDWEGSQNLKVHSGN